MKQPKVKRGGAKDGEKTFGNGQLQGIARWILVHKNGEIRHGYGTTAFQACASVGWMLGELGKDPQPV
jgi:hypothetical protein